ncbi:MAG: sigma-70 family RNA polymerase sigma factor [Microscillaceae bacterium]|nr:sigma-70 family RNA polymerase sigma factor [Microscillaceae bacterium]
MRNQAPPDTHGALVEACRRGDPNAQRRLYEQYASAMFTICMRMTNQRDEAEDILQEAFCDAFRRINSFKGESTFGAWLKRIVINRSINHLKRKRLDWVSLEGRDFREEEEGPEAETTTHWEVQKVHRGIQALPDGFRMVLTLYLIEGYDHGEIAEILNISESTSKSQYNRAKKRLLKILQTEN